MRKYAALLNPKLSGISLIEMLIGLSVAALLMIFLISSSSLVINYSADTLKRGQLKQELQAALNLITDDIRRAGYWGQASNSLASGSNNNPFMSASNITTNASGDCILLGYDRDKDGSANTSGNANSSEHFGYRLAGGAIQALTNDTDFSCASTSSAWTNITDPTVINITNLSFSLSSNAKQTIDIDGSGPGTATMSIRYLTIDITGRLVSDSNITQTLTETIRVRNDRYTS